MERIWTDHLTVRHHECGPDAKLKLNSLFDYRQDAAAGHADHLGVGIQFLAEHRMLWVLSRVKLRIARMPAIGERICVTTYPSGPEKIFATRQYAVCDEKGELIIYGTSFWLLLDGAKFRPLKPLQHLGNALPANGDQIRYFSGLDKLEGNPAVSELREYTVSHSMIDVNRHLNNAYYAFFTNDALGMMSGAFRSVSEIQVNFNHSGALGDRIVCRGSLSSGCFYVDGRSPDGSVTFFQASGAVNDL